MVFPFLTLQALGLGLTYADISIVYGLSPVLCLGAQPLAGREINTSSTKVHTKQISGFIGDKIGFRVVLMIYVLLNLLLETSLTLIPVYQELQQIPHVLLYKNISATTFPRLSFAYTIHINTLGLYKKGRLSHVTCVNDVQVMARM